MFCSLLFNFVKQYTVLYLSTGWSHVTEHFNINRAALSYKFLLTLVAVSLALECYVLYKDR